MGQKKGRVLCVDDEPNILRSLQWLLQRNFEVVTATSGLEGLALVRNYDFDVVVSDQRMPGMMGSEFLREVRKIAPRAMRILLTGYSDMQAILRSVNESEVFRFVNKPWNIQQLPMLVEEAAAISQASPAPLPVPEPDAKKDGVLEVDKYLDAILLVDEDQTVADLLRQTVGPDIRILHAKNIAEAVAALSDNDIGVLVSETQVGSVDTTRLLKLLKQQQPEIVTVVIATQADASEVIGLINQGQIYRYVPKPIKPGFFRIVVTAAALKRQQLKLHPDFARRHAVERTAVDLQQELLADVKQLAARIPGVRDDEKAAGSSLLQKVSGGFRRLFGA